MNRFLLALSICLFAFPLASQITLDIENNDAFDSFQYFEESPDSARIFLAGENHAFRPFNNLIKEKTLRYLHRERDVRLWLSEMGAGRAYLVNRILQGDTALLQTLEPIAWDEDIEQYRRLQAFNDTLPEADRITIHGVDVEHGWLSLVLALDHILDRPSVEAHDSIRLDLESIHGLAREIKSTHDESNPYIKNYGTPSWVYDHVNIANLRHFYANISRHRAKLNAFLGADRADFERVFDCLGRTLQYQVMDEENLVYANVYREQHLAQEVAKLLHDNPGKNAFGQFGRCHVSLSVTDLSCTRGVITSLAGRLEQEAEYGFAGKVVSTAYLYPEYNWDAVQNPVYDYVLQTAQAHDAMGVVLLGQAQIPDSLFADVEARYDHYVIYPGTQGDFSDSPSSTARRERGDRGMGMLVVGGQYAMLNDAQVGMAPYLQTLGLEWDASNRQYISLGVGGYGVLDGYNMIWFEFSEGGRQINNDTLEVNWSSALVSWEFGYDLTWASDRINVTPKGLIGGMTNSFVFEERVPVNTLTDPASRSVTRYTLYNNAFLVGAGLNVEYEWTNLLFGVRSTYYRDLSRPQWFTRDQLNTENNRQEVRDAPDTRFHHLSLGGYIAYLF